MDALRPLAHLVLGPGLVATACLLAPAPASAQSTCEFILRFAALRDTIGADTVGSCLEDQRTALGGNAVQRTTKGMIVRRLSDNCVAFTDGYFTWIDGPEGLQLRLNTELFTWEAPPG
jgi:hypothetical protein